MKLCLYKYSVLVFLSSVESVRVKSDQNCNISPISQRAETNTQSRSLEPC